jgi:tetratricopeptide (TPR) repeat protein
MRTLGFLILFSAIFLVKCGTEKNTAITRSYHNLTSFYNILFNGKESFDEGINRYRENYQFDFTRRLPIFIYGNEKLSNNIKPQMDRAIEKASKLIRLHSITAKPENLENKRKLTKDEKEYYNKSEFNRFVDDSYLLMGKAYFWQMDYSTASKILEYAANEFKDREIGFKTKIWLARSYIQLHKYREASEILKELENVEDMPEGISAEFQATYADYFLKQDQPEQAMPSLRKAVKFTSDKQRKTRYSFILAQIWEENDQPRKAFEHYDKVIEMKPDYRMKFNARLKKAWLYKLADIEGKEVKQELEKMLDDDKNSEFKDQIYYALAKIAKEENQTQEALKNFKLSARHSNNNTNQKGLSYLELADIYFAQKNYENAQAYYDSAVTSLETDYPGYTDLYIKNKYLTKLVSNLNVIDRQDSLQRVAQMSESERNELINTLIKQYKEDQQAKKQKELQARQQQNQRLTQSQLNEVRNRNSSSWYFYSQTAVERGKIAFQQKWGNRELEDNWRRSNKRSTQFEDFTQAEEAEKEEEEQLPKTNRKYYVRDLPLNDSLMKVSHQKIQQAYLDVGMTYMNDLENNPKAIEAFRELNERYPNNKFQLTSYYYLYKLYKEEGNKDLADQYKNKIINEYPESNHAKVLIDPDYFKKLEKEHNEIEQFYTKTLESYRNGNYNKVIQNVSFARENFDNKEYHARFDFLKTLSIGKTEDIITYRKSLEELIKKYPDTEIAEVSEDMLAYLNKTELEQLRQHFTQNKARKEKQTKGQSEKETQQTKKPEEEPETDYKPDKEAQYYFVVIANTEKIDINRLKFDLINFNLDYFLQKDYNTTSQKFNDYYTVVSVKRFENLEAVKEYYGILEKKEERVFSGVDSDDYNYFYISVKNYLTLLEKKSIIEYIKFFDKNLANR